jgi:hypothetical protein
MLRRQGQAEDPWISITNHKDSYSGAGNILYAEGNWHEQGYQTTNALRENNGADIYIR